VNINSLQNIAAVLNDFILTIADNIANKDISNITDNNTININSDTFTHFMSQAFTTKYPYMNSQLTTTKEIENIIKPLKSKNSQGCDEISTKIVNISSPFISLPLNYICSKTVCIGMLSDRLKYLIIKPLYKKGNKHDASNIRSVSLLTSFSKIFEKIMQSRPMDH